MKVHNTTPLFLLESMSNQSLNINENFLLLCLSSRQHPFPMNTVCLLMGLVLQAGTVGCVWSVNFQYDKEANGLWVFTLGKIPIWTFVFTIFWWSLQRRHRKFWRYLNDQLKQELSKVQWKQSHFLKAQWVIWQEHTCVADTALHLQRLTESSDTATEAMLRTALSILVHLLC